MFIQDQFYHGIQNSTKLEFYYSALVLLIVSFIILDNIKMNNKYSFKVWSWY